MAVLLDLEAELVSLKEQEAAETDPIKAKKKKLHIRIQQCEQRIVDTKAAIVELKSRLDYWMKENQFRAITSFETGDVKLALCLAQIPF